jgi:hypothetical protein
MVPLAFSELSFAFFLEMSVFFKIPSTVEEVEKLLKNTNPSKAMGPDRIPKSSLKHALKNLRPA